MVEDGTPLARKGHGLFPLGGTRGQVVRRAEPLDGDQLHRDRDERHADDEQEAERPDPAPRGETTSGRPVGRPAPGGCRPRRPRWPAPGRGRGRSVGAGRGRAGPGRAGRPEWGGAGSPGPGAGAGFGFGASRRAGGGAGDPRPGRAARRLGRRPPGPAACRRRWPFRRTAWGRAAAPRVAARRRRFGGRGGLRRAVPSRWSSAVAARVGPRWGRPAPGSRQCRVAQAGDQGTNLGKETAPGRGPLIHGLPASCDLIEGQSASPAGARVTVGAGPVGVEAVAPDPTTRVVGVT